MNAYLETFLKRRGIRCCTSVGGTCLFVLEVAEGRYVLSILKDSKDQSEGQNKQNVTIESPSAANSLGRIAVLDAHEKFILASLADRRRLYVVPLPKQPCRVATDRSVHDLGFEGELFGLKSFRNRLKSYSNDCSGITAAISALGEVTLLCATGNRPKIKRRIVDVPAVERVAYVTTYEDDYLIIVGLRNSNLLFYAIRMNPGEELESVQIEVLPEILLPHAPRDAPSLHIQDGIIGFAIQKEGAVVLYPGGYVHILGPSHEMLPSTDVPFASCWFSESSEDSGPTHVSSATLRHAMRLSQGRTVANELAPSEDMSSLSYGRDRIVTLGFGFFAIAYGEYVSVWDGTYCTGHSYVQVPTNADFLCRDASSGRVFVASKDTVQVLRFRDKPGFVSPTLSAAIKYKGGCEAIVVSIQQNVERAPLRSQPVTVGPVQAAAESGGQIDRIFRRLMETEEDQEVKQIRALLSREAIPSAEIMIEKTRTYVRHKRKVRRGNYGSESNLGLAKLPSERLAAVTVARCVFEVACGNSSFVVPFIDMLGTGVVSSEAVVSVLSVSDSWDIGPETNSLRLSSICDPFITCDAYLNALEAVLSRIADLPERDIVKVFRFAVQLIVKTGSTTERESLKRWRCKRLLARCMSHNVRQSRLVQIIKKLPFSDAMACIGVLEEFLNDDLGPPGEGKSKVPRQVRTGQFVKNGISRKGALVYRGLGNWVDEDYRQRLDRREIDETEACVRWISNLIDAHLAALIMDENGQQMASRVLELIRIRRKETEALKGLLGLVSHLVARTAVSGQEDPLYRVRKHQVPFQMALE